MQAVATGKPPKKAPRGNRKPPRGPVRPRHEVLRLMDVCEDAILLGLPRYQIRAMLGKAANLPGPMSARTTDHYIARVNQRHQENPLPELAEARAQAVRRCQRMITSLIAQGGDGHGRVRNEAAILRWEARLASLRGLDAIRDQEAVQSAALAIVMDRIARAVQEKEQAATLREDQEARRQRELEAIDVPARPAEGNGDGNG